MDIVPRQHKSNQLAQLSKLGGDLHPC